MKREVQARIPATIVGLGTTGGGLRLPLDQGITIAATRSDAKTSDVRIERQGTLGGPEGERYGERVLAAYQAAVAKAGWETRGKLHIRLAANAPRGRGLGLSAAATVAGIVAASALHRPSLSEEEIAELAIAVTGDEERTLPVALGGAWLHDELSTGGGPYASSPVPIHPTFSIVVATLVDDAWAPSADELSRVAPIGDARLIEGLVRGDVGRVRAALEATTALLGRYRRCHGPLLRSGGYGALATADGRLVAIVPPAIGTIRVVAALEDVLAPLGQPWIATSDGFDGYRVLPRTRCEPTVGTLQEAVHG